MMELERENRKYQYWAAFAVALTAMTNSAAFSWTIPVIPKLHNNETNLNITDTQISWVIVSFSPGTILGTIASQYSSDICGRRTTLLASAIPFCIGTMFILLFTAEVWVLYIARFCWGFGGGFAKIASQIYIAEIASKEIRGVLSVGSRFMFNFGSLMVVSIGSFVSFNILSYLMIILPVTYFVACWCISETPYYLLKENKIDAARKELKKLNGYKDKEILEQKLNDMRRHVKEDMRRSTTIKELVTGKRYRKALLISFGIRLFHALSGVLTVSQYLGRIMQDTKSSISISTALITSSALTFLVTMASSGIIDRVGRRPLLIYSYIGAFLCVAVVGICFFIQEVINIEKDSALLGNIVFFGLVLFHIISSLGFDTLIAIIPAEIFPLNVKSIAITSTNLFGSLIAFGSIRGYQIAKDLIGLHGVFCFYGIVCIAGALFSYYVVLETRGKSLRDIQIELQGSLYEIECEETDLMNKQNRQIEK